MFDIPENRSSSSEGHYIKTRDWKDTRIC